MTTQMTRAQWLQRLDDACEQVGSCLEWRGRFMGQKTPIAYVPRGYLKPDLSQGSHSARAIFWTLEHGEPPPDGHVLRSKCRNYSCVAVGHMVLLSRAKAPKEMGKRGEFSTPKRNAAAIRRARGRETKLSVEKAREIRESTESSRALAVVYGISDASVRAVRRGDLWPEAVAGSSVFSWRPAA